MAKAPEDSGCSKAAVQLGDVCLVRTNETITVAKIATFTG
jgi:hypothetical protein